MTATLYIDGQAHTLGPRTAKIVRQLMKIEDRIEQMHEGVLELKFNNGGKVFARLTEALETEK